MDGERYLSVIFSAEKIMALTSWPVFEAVCRQKFTSNLHKVPLEIGTYSYIA